MPVASRAWFTPLFRMLRMSWATSNTMMVRAICAEWRRLSLTSNTPSAMSNPATRPELAARQTKSASTGFCSVVPPVNCVMSISKTKARMIARMIASSFRISITPQIIMRTPKTLSGTGTFFAEMAWLLVTMGSAGLQPCASAAGSACGASTTAPATCLSSVVIQSPP